MWQEINFQRRNPDDAPETHLVGQQFLDFINGDILRETTAQAPWTPLEAELFWDSAQTIIHPERLAVVVKAWDSHPEKRKMFGQGILYEVTQFVPNPSADPSRYFDPTAERFGFAYDVKNAPFTPVLKIGLIEVRYPTDPPKVEFHPRKTTFYKYDSATKTVLEIPEYGGITLSYSSADEGGLTSADIEIYSGKEHSFIKAKGDATSFSLFPPYMRADGEGSISGVDLKRLMLGEPSNLDWKIDEKSGMIRFGLTSRETNHGDNRNPWYIEFKLGSFDVSAVRILVNALNMNEGEIVEALFKQADMLSLANPFENGVYIGVNFDKPQGRQPRRPMFPF